MSTPTKELLRKVLSIIEQTDPDRPVADLEDRPWLSGADVVQCLCEMEQEIRDALREEV